MQTQQVKRTLRGRNLAEIVGNIKKNYGSDVAILTTKVHDREHAEVSFLHTQSKTQQPSREQKKPKPQINKNLFLALVKSGFHPELAKGLALQIAKPSEILARNLARYLRFNFRLSGSSLCLVGRRGVGKTLTAVKLCKKLQEVRLNCKIINGDIEKLGAQAFIRQLGAESGCEIVPLNGINQSLSDDIFDTLKVASAKLAIVDTPGFSPQESRSIIPFQYGLTRAGKNEFMLVLDATSNEEEYRKTVKVAKKYGVKRVIITKLDEATHLGPLLNVLVATKIEIAFLGTGSLISNLEPASPSLLAYYIVQSLIHR